MRAASFPSKYDTTRPAGSTPSACVSRRSRLVSSAATTSAAASSAASRGGASATSPIGVPASTSRPSPAGTVRTADGSYPMGAGAVPFVVTFAVPSATVSSATLRSACRAACWDVCRAVRSDGSSDELVTA